MSITLLCLVKGNTPANAFPVDIDKDQLVGHLKKVIKAEIQNDFAGLDSNKLKLWKVTIPDDRDDPISNLSLEDSEELLAIRKISKYFPDSPLEEHIHVLVSPPETTTASSEVLELREQIASLQALFNKSEYEFDVIVSPKRTNGFKWIVNIEEATLEGLKNSIREMNLGLPALENDGVNIFKLIVVIETPSKAFSDWSFPKVCQLYELGESDDPSLSVFPPFTCEYKDLENDSSRVILRNLITELEARLKSIPISGNEASKSQYVCSYLVAGVNLYEGKFELRPEKNITGPNGHGPFDFAIDLLRTAKTVGVTEVKDEDIFKGIAQNAVQLESALSNRKRKASEMEEKKVFTGKTFGIITDAKEWYFMECSLDDQDKLVFKLSKPVTVVYDSKNMGENVERVLGHIAWLLEEVQKPDSDSQSEERVIKKHRSSSNLTGKLDK
ncbi:10409_t:CDS:2 [Cetraspora pellucida]|uniref:10409_t:CDS:1 n=1 Tax=Cetraspora pellucida TaxID=1433469 RepID=A0ACA9LXA9_9GLOM|nr:10409_t:CDS:2 [Cetraspora pellucida]